MPADAITRLFHTFATDAPGFRAVHAPEEVEP